MIKFLEGSVTVDDVDEFLHRLKEKSSKNNQVIQVLNADKLAGEEHIRFAVEKAVTSFEKGTNIANDLAKEIMLYAAGTRQINRAVKLGIHKGKNNIVLVAVGEKPDLLGFDDITPAPVLGYTESKKKELMDIFNITDEEIKVVGADRIPELVLERVALVDVMK
jgi:KEOPS complex subunit Cgi121